MLPVRELVASLVFCSILDLGEGRFRRKRIIEGKYGLDRSEFSYPGERYSVWIGDGMLYPKWGLFFDFPIEADPKHNWCGGVLITPTIVQTACSCVAFFFTNEHYPSTGYFTRARPMTVWEYLLQVFVGDSDVYNMLWLFLAKHYFVYEKCTKVEFPTHSEHEWVRYVSYDYGLMILERDITFAPKAQITYAPSPTFEDIIRFYHLALQNEYVCLFFGYGYFRGPDRYDVPGWGNNSLSLLYGWRSLMSYQNCYLATMADTVDMNAYKEGGLDYHEIATWVCAVNYGVKYNPSKFLVASTDRGGAVTCNNEYFGVISDNFKSQLRHLSSDEHRPYVKFNLFSPIVFTLWENSVNYRELFIKDTMAKVSGQTWPDPFDVIINWKPTFKLLSDSESPFSQSPRISGYTHFVLFFASLSKLLP